MEETIVIDRELCIGCGKCVNDCPGAALTISDGKAKYLHRCISCGHCVAVCPMKAVSIPSYDMEDVEEYDEAAFSIEPEHFLHAVKFRRSVRNFLPKPLEIEQYQRIIDAGRYTATAKNLQACTFVVVRERLAEFKQLFWQEFPAVLKVLGESNPAYVKPFTRFYEAWQKNPELDSFFFNTTSLLIIAADYPLDGGLAASNMEQMAVAEGAGVLYSGYLQRTIGISPVLLSWLGLEGRNLACCMLLGYPAVKYVRTAPRKKADVNWR